MKNEDVLLFVGYLFETRHVEGLTASKYLSALRTLHLTRGYAEPALRPAIVQAVIKGRRHWDEESKRLDPKKIRLPVTLDVLKLLKITLSLTDWPRERKVLVEAVALICFNGGERFYNFYQKFILNVHIFFIFYMYSIQSGGTFVQILQDNRPPE